MTTFNTNEEGIINSFRYHDLIFESLEVSEDKLFLIIQDNDKRHKTRIVLEGIKYLEVKELIPKGIVLSCYSFVFSKCPVHLKDELDRSCDLIDSQLQQKLNARVNLAKSESKRPPFRLAYALAPLALVITVWFNSYNDPGLTEDEIALYDDLELIIAEGELDFLDSMDVSDWIAEVPETNEG